MTLIYLQLQVLFLFHLISYPIIDYLIVHLLSHPKQECKRESMNIFLIETNLTIFIEILDIGRATITMPFFIEFSWNKVKAKKKEKFCLQVGANDTYSMLLIWYDLIYKKKLKTWILQMKYYHIRDLDDMSYIPTCKQKYSKRRQ